MIIKEEYELLKYYHTTGYGWIARDKNGDLYAFKTLPMKFKFFWSVKRGSPYPRLVCEREENILTCVTWEDEKQTKILDLIQDYEKHEELKSKVQIPQFVADWIENRKKNRTLAGLFMSDDMPKDVSSWIAFNNDNCEKMALAWIFGYEVEKEKLYTVRLANGSCLYKFELAGISWTQEYSNYEKDIHCQLTQSEIESVDPRLMQFAVEVE